MDYTMFIFKNIFQNIHSVVQLLKAACKSAKRKHCINHAKCNILSYRLSHILTEKDFWPIKS